MAPVSAVRVAYGILYGAFSCSLLLVFLILKALFIAGASLCNIVFSQIFDSVMLLGGTIACHGAKTVTAFEGALLMGRARFYTGSFRPTANTKAYFSRSTYQVGVPILRLLQNELKNDQQKLWHSGGSSPFFQKELCSSSDCFFCEDFRHAVCWATKYYYGSVFFCWGTCGLLSMWFFNAFVDLFNGVYGIDDEGGE